MPSAVVKDQWHLVILPKAEYEEHLGDAPIMRVKLWLKVVKAPKVEKAARAVRARATNST